MATYSYKAYSVTGKLISGELESTSEGDAFAVLRSKNLVPVSIDGSSSKRKQANSFARTTKRYYNKKNLARFTRMMANLLTARIPLLEALSITVDSERNLRFKKALIGIHEAVRSGSSLSDAIIEQTNFAPIHYTGLIVAGEKSGSLPLVLDDLANQIEHQIEMAGRIRAGILYPAILFATSMIVLTLISTILVPAVKPLFQDSGAELPPIIEFIDQTNQFVSKNSTAVLTGILFLLITAIYSIRIPSVSFALERMNFALPLFGGMRRNIEFSQFSRTAGMMLLNGVPLVSSLEAAQATFRSQIMKQTVATATANLREGRSLAGSLETSPSVPHLAKRLIKIGEETGTLPDIMMHVGKTLEKETLNQIAIMFQLIPPILTLAIGLGVGSFIFLIMDAVMGVNELAF